VPAKHVLKHIFYNPVFLTTLFINLDSFFEQSNQDDKEQVFKIVLEYTEEDYNSVLEALKKHSGSKENIIANLLGV
jgi:oligoribonuclease NrnB/cAMP/cGMP phosphodiesterase (DHH superfamily)